MNPIIRNVLLMGLVLLMFVGCRTAQIYNVTESAITPVSNNQPSLEEVTKAIIAAGTVPHPSWNMQIIKPGHIVGRLNVRSHMAAVDIFYTPKSYSIQYKESSNLKYDAGDGTIHSNYNGWVQRLDSAIKGKLAEL